MPLLQKQQEEARVQHSLCGLLLLLVVVRLIPLLLLRRQQQQHHQETARVLVVSVGSVAVSCRVRRQGHWPGSA